LALALGCAKFLLAREAGAVGLEGVDGVDVDVIMRLGDAEFGTPARDPRRA
jgi:hypothetical protein